MVTTNTNIKNVRNGQKMTIIMPNKTTTTSSKEGNLVVNLPPAATKANVVPTFKKSLISIPQVVDTGYKALFEKTDVKIINNKTNKI